MKNKVKKVPAIEISKIGGLKCDNPMCNWEDKNIKVEDYIKYINYKCPKCGDIVFAEKDYKSFKFILRLIKIFNFILPKRMPNKDKDVEMSCEFEGNGIVKTKIKTNN